MKKIIIALLSLGVLMSCSTIFLPFKDKSVLEARTLSTFTKPSVKSVLSGNYFVSFEEAFDDQITGRNNYLSFNSKIQDVLQVKYRNDVFLGNKDFLFRHTAYQPTTDQSIENEINKKIEILEQVYNEVDSNNLFMYVHIPSKVNVYYDQLPKSYLTNQNHDQSRKNLMREKIEKTNSNIIYIDGEKKLSEKKDDYIFFKTDHHYTGLGAYYIYEEIISSINSHSNWNLTIPQYDDFYREVLKGDFVGSEARLISDLNYSKVDYVDAGLPKNMPEFSRLDNGEKSDVPLVDYKHDSIYTTYMGRDWGNTIVETENIENPKILIIGDSFTNALEPLFVYNSHEMHSIDPRHYEESLFEYINNVKPDITIVVRDSLLSDNLIKEKINDN